MKKFVFIVLVFSISIYQGRGQWSWQYPIPQGNLIRAIQGIGSTDTFYGVGPNGTAIKSTDAGLNWSNLDSLTSEDINGLFFLNENSGYFVGTNGLILKMETDTVWTKIETGTHYALNAVAFTDEQTGIFAGYKGLAYTSDGVSLSQITTNTTLDLLDVEFIDASHAIMIGNSGLILKSSDAGNSWQTISSGVSFNLNNVYFPSPLVGYIVGQKAIILKTIDGGDSWTNISSTVIDNDLFGVHFINDTAGYVGGSQGMVLSTLNGGQTWHYRGVPTDGTNYAVHQFILPSDSTNDKAMVCGSYGAVYQTDSVTATTYYWKNLTGGNSHSITSMHISIDGQGMAVGGDFFGDHPDILVTSNGGDDWSLQVVDTVKHFLNDISVVGNNRSYVCGNNGSVYRVHNGIWTPLMTGNTKDLYGIAALDTNLIYSAGINGAIIKTISSDTLWQLLNTPTELNLYDIAFITSSWGYAVGEEGVVLRILEGGAFIQKINQVWTPMYSIYFLNDTLGFMAGFNGKIFKIEITEEGEIFTSVPSGVTAPLNAIYFPSADTGFISGDGGVVLKTTDGGNTWYPVYTGTNNSLRTLCFKNSSEGLVAGAGMTILKTTIGGGPVITPGIFEQPQPEIPILLYPNPVSGKAWVEYVLADKSNVCISLIDLSGRTLRQLKQGWQGKGLQRIPIQINNIQQGIYLVMLHVGDRSFARKLIVLP